MGLRNAADYRTLLWVFLAAVCVAVQYANPALAPYLCVASCYFALACGVIAHNHNHCTTFKSKRANRVFGNILSVFYGYPTFAWIPTHNLNHHKYVNRAGDATITWRYTNRHNFFVAATYFFVSSYFQSELITNYIRKVRRKNPDIFRQILTAYAVWLGTHIALLSLAIAIHGLKTGFFVWSLACLIPALFALWTIMLFNYEQHVHTDPWSKHNHSRSWDGKFVNFMLFNNGLHAAHHENPGMHWSKLREVHTALAPQIDPALINGSMWWYFIRMYLIAPLVPSFRTVQVGRAPFQTPDGSTIDLASADVEIGEAGSNTDMLPAAN
jgi:fatty acid desaturase